MFHGKLLNEGNLAPSRTLTTPTTGLIWYIQCLALFDLRPFLLAQNALCHCCLRPYECQSCQKPLAKLCHSHSRRHCQSGEKHWHQCQTATATTSLKAFLFTGHCRLVTDDSDDKSPVQSCQSDNFGHKWAVGTFRKFRICRIFAFWPFLVAGNW